MTGMPEALLRVIAVVHQVGMHFLYFRTYSTSYLLLVMVC